MIAWRAQMVYINPLIALHSHPSRTRLSPFPAFSPSCLTKAACVIGTRRNDRACRRWRERFREKFNLGKKADGSD